MKTSRRILMLACILVVAGTPFSAWHGVLVLAQGDTGPGLIVFSSNRSGDFEIYVLDPETGLTVQLTNSPGNDIEPLWSPDGSQIAFTSDRDGDYELFVMLADGSGLRQVTKNLVEDRQPRWQPGGKHIVYASNVNGQWDLYDVVVDTGIVRQLTNDPADERGPVAEGGGVVAPGGQVGPVVATATVAPPTLPDAVVNADTLNVRENPGEGARILMKVTRDTALDIMGRYPDNSWVQVRTPNGTAGWVYRPLLTINIDLSIVPVVNATFMAPPPTATSIPPTPVPVTQANLVAGIVVFDPAQPNCAQTFTVGFDVANLGSQPTSASGTVSLVDTRASDGSQQGSTIGGFPILQPGQTFRVNMPLTISTWYSEQHNITLVIDPANQIPENVEGDNVRTVSYTLQKGGCP